MRRWWVAAGIAIGCSTTVGTASAQPAACTAIDAAAARLECYDAAAHRDAAAAKATYKPVDLLDFKVEEAQLIGARVELKGYAAFAGPTIALQPGPFAGTTVYVGTSRLPKADQRALLAQCSQIPCRVTFRGEVVKGTQDITDVDAEAMTLSKR